MPFCVWMGCGGGVITQRRHLLTVNKGVVWRTANAGIKYQVALTWRQTNDNEWLLLREWIWSHVFTALSRLGLRTHSHSDTDSAPPLLFYTREVFWPARLDQIILKVRECFTAQGHANTLNARLYTQIWQISGSFWRRRSFVGSSHLQ